MKRSFNLAFSFILIAFIFVGCDKGSSVNPVAKSILGRWQLTGMRGGLTDGIIPLPEGTIVYTFSADGTYSVSPGIGSGNYQIIQQKSIFDGKMHPFLSFGSNTTGGGLVDIKNDTLSISDNHVESVSSTYVRLK